MDDYITTDGPPTGALYSGHFVPSRTIGVFDPDDPSRPIGFAQPWGMDALGRVSFKLHVRGTDLAGLWAVVDRHFVPAQM